MNSFTYKNRKINYISNVFSCLFGIMLIPCNEGNSAPLPSRPKSFGEKCPLPAPGKASPAGKPKPLCGGGRPNIEAIVEAMVEVGVISDGGSRRPGLAAGGLDAGETEEPERSGEEEAAAVSGFEATRTMVEVVGELLGGEEEEELSLNWERSVGPLDGAVGKLNILQLQG
jgi:hypothetical protein